MRRFALAVIACALLGAWSAVPAGAHTGQDDGMSCAGITLDLAGFPAGENSVTTTITIDGVPIDPVVSTFQGPAATLIVPLPPFTGRHVVMYQTSWTVDGGGQTDVAQTEDWDNSGVMTYANGNQANDRRHQIKLRGYYQVTPEWLLGGTAQILSGTPRTCLGYFGTEQSDPFGYAAAYHFCGPEGTPAPGGATGRTPWQEIVSLNAEYRPAFAQHKLAFSVLVYNIFNQQKVTQYYATSESGPGVLSKDFWVPISQATPRYIQLGVTYDF